MKEILVSRSQKRLHKQLEKADAKRQDLLDKGRLSLPSGLGKLVIIVSPVPSFNPGIGTPEEQKKSFLMEAERLREDRKENHQQIVIRPRAIIQDMMFDFKDPEVTDIVLIGHGTISSMWTNGGKHFDWRHAAKATTELKQGKIEHMGCGHFPLGYNVPLGSFAVSQLSNVRAAVGEMISIPDGSPREDLFQPVFTDDTSLLPQIEELNQQYRVEQPVKTPAQAARQS